MSKRIAGPNNCKECPFKSRTVGSRGSIDAPIVIVGESPGSMELIAGQPFIGPSGRLLSTLLKEVGIEESDCFITNAFKCLPPRSKDAQGNSVKGALINDACRACRSKLMREIAARPRQLVITMGSAAARSLSESWGYSITKSRGQVLEGIEGFDGEPVSELGVLPTLHPAYILRNPAAMPQLRSDMRKAADMLNGKQFPKPKIQYVVIDDVETLRRVIDKAYRALPIGEKLRVVADIETTGLDRFQEKFLCIGFIFEHQIVENGTNLVYIIDIRSRPSGQKNRAEVLKKLFSYMPSGAEWIWHNGKFDTSFMRAKKIPRAQCRVDQDTLLLSYTLDETGGRHGLEQCIIDHLGLPAYKDMLAEYVGTGKKKKSYADVPLPVLHKYNAKDVVYTGLVFRKLFPKVMRRSNLKKAYLELLIPASNTLATIELNGMPLNQEILCAAEEKLDAQIEPVLAELRRIIGDSGFNPNSPKQVLPALKRHCGLKINSTDEDTLKKHNSHLLVKTLLEYRGLHKLVSTYVRGFKKYGNRIHTSYLIHGTVTGRLSSTSPNMQNIPKEDVVRAFFTPPKGRVLVSFDYSQAELRSLAVLSGDKNLINIFKSGKDMHSAVAAQVYGKKFTVEPKYLPNPDPNVKIENPVFSKYRRNAKVVNFGIVYGATEPTLMERLGITWDEAHELIVGWFRMFPDAKKFMNECRNAPLSGVPLSTVFGRQRRFYVVTQQNKHGLENEAGNFPHQSMCSDFTLAAAIEIDRLHAKGLLPGNANQINIIHDDNMFEIDDDMNAIVGLAKTVMPIMQNVPVKQGITELTFKSDAMMGYSWNRMQEIKGL